MAKAQWTTKRTEIVAVSRADGSLHAELPLYDGAVKQLTFVLDIDADRNPTVLVHGEDGATLGAFRAWSDI